jgi:hypothetical protein
LRNVVKYGKYALQSLQILYTFVLRAEIASTIFGPNVVAISARNTKLKVYKICELCKAIFSAFYNISKPNIAILLILVRSFRGYTFAGSSRRVCFAFKITM